MSTTERYRPTEIALPDVDIEPGADVDTWGIQLDRAYQLIHGTEAWFENNPESDCFTFYPDVPASDIRNKDKYVFTVTRDTLQILKKHPALTRYEYLRNHSPLGHELARDIAASWKEPRE